MLYGCKFGEKHTLNDWGLMQISPPKFSPPTVNTEFLSIVGRNGTIDASEVLTDDVTFGDRDFECEYQLLLDREEYPRIYSEILNYLHGRRMRCVYDTDQQYYYIGRFQIDSFKSQSKARRIVIKGQCYPFKLELFSSTDDWLWDPFSFVDGIIREYKRIPVSGYKRMLLPGRRMPVSPTINVTITAGKTITMLYDGIAHDLTNGINYPEIVIREGEHVVEFIGNGIATIEYRGGML